MRCSWCGEDPLYVHYHDTEWGVPEHDDRALFEKLVLDGFQAGLSWLIILRKRDNFRRAFDGFQPERIVGWDGAKRAALLADAGIVRNRQKIDATVDNARAWLKVQAREGSFATWLWQFVDGEPLVNRWETMAQVPASTPASVAMSKALKAEGFRFCGPTICYAVMQATGMVNDHMVDCFRHAELAAGPPA